MLARTTTPNTLPTLIVAEPPAEVQRDLFAITEVDCGLVQTQFAIPQLGLDAGELLLFEFELKPRLGNIVLVTIADNRRDTPDKVLALHTVKKGREVAMVFYGTMVFEARYIDEDRGGGDEVYLVGAVVGTVLDGNRVLWSRRGL